MPTLTTRQQPLFPKRRDPGEAATLGPWREVGATARITAQVHNGADPPTTAVGFAVDVSSDGGETFTTLTAIAAGTQPETTYSIRREVTSSQGTHYRVRFAGNLGGSHVSVSASMSGTLVV